MNSELGVMTLVFTSFKDSIGMEGLKVSIDRHAPRLCSYPTLLYLTIPINRSLSTTNMERICDAILDNNWDLIQDFIGEMYNLGIYQIVLCDWATKEQISHGKFCAAGIIGKYIRDKADRDGRFEFPIETEYRDGREVL